MALFFDTVELTGSVQIGNTSFTPNGSVVRHNTAHGYIELGPANTSHAHIQTDRSNFYFNKEIRVNSGGIGSYDEDLDLRRAGTSKITAGENNIYIKESAVILENWSQGDHPEQLSIVGSYPSMTLRNNAIDHKWLIHHDGNAKNIQFYEGNDWDSNAWTRRFAFRDSGDIEITKTSGPMIVTGSSTDAFGYNSNYGHYISGNGGTYVYGNGSIYDGTANRTIWHDGNDGSGSGLDADLLDGYHASSFFIDGDTVLNMANNDGLVYNDSNNLMYIKADGTDYQIIDTRGGTFSGQINASGGINMNNTSITGVDNIVINDAGYGEGIYWNGGNGWRISEAPDNLTNASGNLQFTTGSGSRMVTFGTSGQIYHAGNIHSDGMQRPVARWGVSGSSTGMVAIALPGNTGDYDMTTIEIEVYEYNSNSGSKIRVSGHTWTSGIGWYNYAVQVEGRFNKPIRLGQNGSKFYILLGNTNSSWNYGSVIVRANTEAQFYNNITPWQDSWSITQVTTDPTSSNSGDLNTTSSVTHYTSGMGIAEGQFRTPIYYDLNNTAYYVDPNSSSNLQKVTIVGTANGNDPTLRITSTTSNTFNHAIEAFNSNLTTGEHNIVLFGQQGNTKNSGYIGYYWSAAGSNNNFVTIGHWGADDLFRVYPDQITGNSSFRAPIFYDSNNTAYYVDANNTSNLSKLKVGDSFVNTQDKVRNIDTDNYFNINDNTTVDEFVEQWGSLTTGSVSNITKVDDNTAPAPGCFEFAGPTYIDSSGDYIKIDPNAEYTFECWIKYVSGSGTDCRLYLGWSMYNSSKSYFGNTQRYWGASAFQVDANSNNNGWYKVTGTISGIGSGTGQFISGTQYVRPLFLINYVVSGTVTTRLCGFKLYKSDKRATELTLTRKGYKHGYLDTTDNGNPPGYVRLSNHGGDILKIQSDTGYVNIGSDNASYAHFGTDRGGYYFDKNVHFDGVLYDYDNTNYYLNPYSNSQLQTLSMFPSTNGVGAKINFSDHASGGYTQYGILEYLHADTASYGAGNCFKFYGTEASMTFHVAGRGIFQAQTNTDTTQNHTALLLEKTGSGNSVGIKFNSGNSQTGFLYLGGTGELAFIESLAAGQLTKFIITPGGRGSVGIGGINPNYRLHVYDGDGLGTASLGNRAAVGTTVQSGAALALRSPGAGGSIALDLVAQSYGSAAKMYFPQYSSGMTVTNGGTVSQNAFAFMYSSSSVGSIRINSTSTSYNTTSDYRLKENIVPITGAIERLNQLNPSRFTWISDPEAGTVDGFIAHEVSDVVPEAVSGQKDGVDYLGMPEYQGIDQSKLVPLLTAALQEAIAKIESLEARIQVLENQ